MEKAERDRAYYLANRERILERQRVHHAANRGAITAQKRARYAVTREQTRERTEAYRAANPEKVRAAHAAYQASNPEKVREWRRAWALRNPERVRASKVLVESRRRARKAGVAISFTKDDWQAALDFFENACAYCGAVEALEIEHVVPLKRPECAPTHGPENVLPACRPCNRSKRDKLVSEWRPEVAAALVARVLDWNAALVERIGLCT